MSSESFTFERVIGVFWLLFTLIGEGMGYISVEEATMYLLIGVMFYLIAIEGGIRHGE